MVVGARFIKGSEDKPRFQMLSCSGPQVFVVNFVEPGVSKQIEVLE